MEQGPGPALLPAGGSDAAAAAVAAVAAATSTAAAAATATAAIAVTAAAGVSDEAVVDRLAAPETADLGPAAEEGVGRHWAGRAGGQPAGAELTAVTATPVTSGYHYAGY